MRNNRYGLGRYSGLVALLAFIVALLVGYDLTNRIEAASKIEVVGLRNVAVDMREGVVELSFQTIIWNPSKYNMTVEDLIFKIYLNGHEVEAGGEIQDILIQAGSEGQISITARSSSPDLWNLVEATKKKSLVLEIKVVGVLRIPIEAFGFLKITSLNRDYTVTAQVKP